MNKFGFELTKGRQIDYESNNRKLAEYIFEKEPSFRLCIECGGCSATCTTGSYTNFSLRELFILIKRGESENVRNKMQKCMLCGKCILVCPRGVSTRNIVSIVKHSFQKSNEYTI